MPPLANIAKSWRFLTVLLLMPLLAGGVSWLAFAGPGIRLAELHSLLQNAGNAGRVPHDPLGDTHTSLYFMVLAGWRAVVGSSPAAVRSLSEIFYLMSIPAMYVAVRAAYGKATGIFAAVMASVSPCMQWQGSEATAFSMLAFWSAINLYYFTRIMLGDERERTAWGWVRNYCSAGDMDAPTFPGACLLPIADRLSQSAGERPFPRFANAYLGCHHGGDALDLDGWKDDPGGFF